ncbi:hypothetical protein JTE90_027219 [Oedothorax gibbosus]|uniref:MIT domain-containing protein n=1 Tax=Oedothorax gibbosus TaxID=931172 RepID=A0AAV6U2D4_9ARAC|nr:hypothetical protein JTE90_027219 [Oedothorax gibbosus]
MCAKKNENVLEGLEQAAIQVIGRAIAFDSDGRYQTALASYQEGIQLFLDVIKNTNDKKKLDILRQKTTEYITRAEKVKEKVQELKDSGNYHEQIHIPNDSSGFSYESIFGKYLGKDVTKVEIDDPYIRTVHQAYNFLSFCELLVKCCPNLREIKLETGVNKQDEIGQKGRLQAIGNSLRTHNVTLIVEYSDSLHDREVRFDNGWIVKIGRGLDFFKPVNKFTIGFSNQSLRLCHETNVDIFFHQTDK